MKDQTHLMSQPKGDDTWMQKTGGFARDMTLRDHFAGLAMQGFMTYATLKSTYAPPDNELAKMAYTLADAMLKARDAK
jgi:hypothetical protein